MDPKTISKLSSKKKYLQIALNSTLDEAYAIIGRLPKSDRIIVEAGTPLIKRYGEEGIRKIRQWYEAHLWGMPAAPQTDIAIGGVLGMLIRQARQQSRMKQAAVTQPAGGVEPYIVADLKTADRGETEVEMAARAGADGAVALGHAPVESLNAFIAKCSELGLDAMIDMMNVEYPLAILRQLKKLPRVVILHRGVDEEKFNKEKQIPLHEIRRIKGSCDMLVAIAGGDSVREVQRAIFNDADIVVVWKEFYQSGADTANLAEQFLAEIK